MPPTPSPSPPPPPRASLPDLILGLAATAAPPDPALPIALSLTAILDSAPLQSDRDRLLDNAARLASALLDAVSRARFHPDGWPLPYDLTVKVLAMLDTKSVCCAAATCKLFRKCSSDPLCYADIDLTTSVAKVTNRVVLSMVLRAGKKLQSIKIGSMQEHKSALSFGEYTFQGLGSCVSPLVWNGGAAGLLVRRLHLYNLRMHFQDRYFCLALSACRSLVELKIVGLDAGLLNILTTIHEHCNSIELLHLEFHDDEIGWNISNSEACVFEVLIKKVSSPFISDY